MKICSKKRRKIYLKESAKKRYRMIGLCLLLLFSISIWFSPFSIVESKNNYTTQEYTVVKGDTLWSIAENIKIPSMDTREVVYDIIQCNNFSDASIICGDIIALPVYK